MKTFTLISLFLLMSACTSYKPEVQQGNLISQETVSKLQKGMSKREVQALLGTPLLQDSFNSNRWDYVFYQTQTEKDSKDRKPQNITLSFQNDQLMNVAN